MLADHSCTEEIGKYSRTKRNVLSGVLFGCGIAVGPGNGKFPFT